jgi:hypothetical protein
MSTQQSVTRLETSQIIRRTFSDVPELSVVQKLTALDLTDLHDPNRPATRLDHVIWCQRAPGMDTDCDLKRAVAYSVAL